jgi:signal transduction histidine kinase
VPPGADVSGITCISISNAWAVAPPSAPGRLAIGLTVLIGLAACALPLWLGVVRWADLRDGHTDLAVPFVITTGMFGVLLVSFPVYQSIIPPDGYSLVNLVISAAILIPWAVFGLRYTGRDHLLTARRIAAGIMLVCLFVGVFVLSVTGRLPSSTATNAVLGIGILALLGGMFAVGGVVLFATYRDADVPLRQSMLLVFPFVLLVISLQGVGTNPNTRTFLNAGVFALATGSLWVAVTRYDVLTRRPATSRLGFQSVVTEMDEAVFVVNTDGSVVNANATARALFDTDVVGAAFEDLLGQQITTLRDRDTIEHQTATGYRQFDPRVSTVTGGGGQRLGATVTLIDVTDREMRRQRIQVLNRILRHNVRNDLDVVLAHTNRIEDQDIRSSIKRTVDGTLRLSSKASEAEAVMTAITDSPEPVDLAAVATAVADQVQADTHGGDVTVEAAEVQVVSHRSVIRRMLYELVENALEHTDCETPRVRITVQSGPDGTAEFVIADNGPGLPDREREILAAGAETQLKHGRGIGLWLVNWAVTQLGGELEFGQNEPTGSIVTVRFHDTAG